MKRILVIALLRIGKESQPKIGGRKKRVNRKFGVEKKSTGYWYSIRFTGLQLVGVLSDRWYLICIGFYVLQICLMCIEWRPINAHDKITKVLIFMNDNPLRFSCFKQNFCILTPGSVASVVVCRPVGVLSLITHT